MTMFVLGVVIAVAAAVRSTWSPCGLSMLSQLTPLAEAGRGQRYPRTAAWFIAGATLGGLALGAVMAMGAALVAAFGPAASTGIAFTAFAALAAAAIDGRVFGYGPPWLCRQVNEAWLSQFRAWVYAGGFGWQIGTGITTYVMTAAVPLLIAVGALTGSPGAALALGVGFGLLRGGAVLLGRSIRTPDALYAAHRRFDTWTGPVRDAVIVVELVVSLVAAWIVAPSLAIVVVVLVAGAEVAVRRPRAGGDPSRSRVDATPTT